jgi:hypothetical protein
LSRSEKVRKIIHQARKQFEPARHRAFHSARDEVISAMEDFQHSALCAKFLW